jgi:hypothetical protein
MNAAPTERRFRFCDARRKIFRNFFGCPMQSALGGEVGKKDAIRFYRASEQSGRYMLRRVTDLRSEASATQIERLALSNESRGEQRASRADVDFESFALTNKSV